MADKKNMVGGKYHVPLSFSSNGVNRSDGVNKSDSINKSNGDWKKNNERLDFNKVSTGGTALTKDLRSLENIW
jgi:hypothetical protein